MPIFVGSALESMLNSSADCPVGIDHCWVTGIANELCFGNLYQACLKLGCQFLLMGNSYRWKPPSPFGRFQCAVAGIEL